MNAFQLKKIAFTLSLSAALSVHAAGLGNMTSSSKLGEPLSAEIELLSVAPNELNSIQAALASEQFYQDQLLEKPNSYPFIKIEVANNQQGQPILKLSSSQPITEAFLDMLIQVDWPTGRLVKEYTLLLDPPGFDSTEVTEPVNLPISEKPAAKTSSTPPTAKPNKADAVPAKSSQSTMNKIAAASDTEATAATTITVKKGDSLHQLAEQLRPDTVTKVQMLAALFQANPDAFEAQNMNRLKVGKVLRVPASATLSALDQAQAQRIVNAHLADWHAYKNGLAQAVKDTPANAQPSGSTQTTAGKIEAANKPAPAATTPSKDVLKLSAGDEKSSVADKTAAKALQDKVSSLQEDLIAKENAIKEEKSRTQELEKQIEDMKKLLALKNDAMAKLQAQATPAAEPQPQTSEAQAATANATTEETPAPPASPANAPVAEAVAPVAPVAPVTPVTPTPPVQAPAPKPAPDIAVTEAVAPATNSFGSFLSQRLKQTHPSLLIGLIVLPLLGCLWLWTRVRRKKQIHTFEEAIMTSPATEMQSNTVFGHTQATSGDTSFLTDFSQSAVGGMIDAHEVDPIAEAEVYMAYGRDAQAEEILKDAIQKDPRRQELKVKLLEIYQATGNATAFETLANTVYSQMGAGGELWPQVAALGRQMDANNPLYRAADETLASAEPADVLADNLDQAADHSLSQELSIAGDAGKQDISEHYDETQALPVFGNGLQPKPIDLPALDFENIDLSDPAVTAPSLTTSGELNLADTDTVFERLPELSFELDHAAPDTNESLAPDATSSDDGVSDRLPALETADSEIVTPKSGGTLEDEGNAASDALTINQPIDTDTDTPVNVEDITLSIGDIGAEEVDTKLDLIKAYIDMEDVIGAKELIEEVMAEGSAEQKQLAQALLKKIA